MAIGYLEDYYDYYKQIDKDVQKYQDHLQKKKHYQQKTSKYVAQA